MDRLPDELLAMIIAPSLRVSDEEFSSTASFAKNVDMNTSAMLLVSKRYCRVATSLLWEVVIIRSKAQAAALARALQEHPEFGPLIKKVRIEGGFGEPMHKIIKLARNVRSLALSLDLLVSDKPSYSKVLPQLDIKTLVLFHSSELDNSNNRKLLPTICNSIAKWKNLDEVRIPYDISQRGPYVRRSTRFKKDAVELVCKALSTAPKLERVYIPSLSSILPQFSELTKNPSVSAIIVGTAPNLYRTCLYPPGEISIREKVEADLRLSALVQWPPAQEKDAHMNVYDLISSTTPISPQVSPDFQPFAGASEETSDALWTIVLDMAVAQHSLYSLDRRHHGPWGIFPFSAVSLVSKKFNKLARPFVYRHLLLGQTHHGSQAKLTRYLTDNKDVARYIQQATFIDELQINYAYELIKIAPNLQRVHWAGQLQQPIEVEHLKAICGGVLGPMVFELPRLSLSRKGRGTPSAIFNSMENLRTMNWSTPLTITAKESHAEIAGYFPRLESLSLAMFDPSFISLLSRIDLPALKHVQVYDSSPVKELFIAHGAKLKSVHLYEHTEMALTTHCPNMETLQISCVDYKPKTLRLNNQFLMSDMPRPALKEIVWNRGYGKVAFWQEFFAPGFVISKIGYPSLERVMISACRWPPVTERRIAKDAWVARADKMALQGVVLTDSSGKGWRPRLK